MSRTPRRMDYGRPAQRRQTVCPWESGFPGGGSGLLPTPSAPNLFNQLSSPEAQLAVASNLLSTLLRPSQQLPSLLEMGERSYHQMQRSQSPSYHDRYGSQYSDYGSSPSMPQHRSFDSYHSRSPTHGASKRNHQPFNGRQSSSGQGGRSSKSSGQQHRGQKDSARNHGDKGDKKDGQQTNEKKGAAYEGLPKAAFVCSLCTKSMWDAVSMDNHIKGMSHQKMLDEREKSYIVKADLLRHEGKLIEQQKQIEMERLVRMGKKNMPTRREFCKMCDFAFFEDMLFHRKTKIHQTLKSFLHPKCTTCHKEFSLRIDLDKHLTSADHLKVAFKDKMKPVDGNKKTEKDQKEGVMAKTEDPEAMEMPEGEVLGTEGDVEMQDEELNADTAAKEIEEISETKEPKVTKEELPEEKKVAVFDPDVSVGEEFLVPVTGIFCKACRRFFLHDDQALESHCRSSGHFKYVQALQTALVEKEKKVHETKPANEKTPAIVSVNQESQVNTATDQTIAGKRPATMPSEGEEDSQDFKRPKTENGDDSEENTGIERKEEVELSAKQLDVDRDIAELESAINVDPLAKMSKDYGPEKFSPRTRRARRGRY